MNNTVAVIIVTYNAESYIENCLNSLKLQDFLMGWSIIIVDNKSVDNTLKIIKDKYQSIEVIENNKNIGFACANNIGIEHALRKGFQFVVLLNQDTIVQKNFISSGVRFLSKNPNIGAAAPTILYNGTDKVWWTGSKLFRNLEILTKPTWKIGLHINKGISVNSIRSINNTNATDWVTGCALFTNKEVIKKCGAFDKSFFMYGEDVDLSLRIKSLGYKLAHFNTTTVSHDVPYPEISNMSIIRKARKFCWIESSNYRIQKKHYAGVEKVYTFFNLLLLPLLMLFRDRK